MAIDRSNSHYKRLNAALRGVFFCSLLCLTASSSAAPLLDFDQYECVSWTAADGLPGDGLGCIEQTDDGYLWIGTTAGLVRFDGVSFTRFDTANTLELTVNAIHGLKKDRHGNLWIVNSNNLVRWNKETGFVRFQIALGSPEEVPEIAIGRDGHAVALLGNSVFRYSANGFKVVRTNDSRTALWYQLFNNRVGDVVFSSVDRPELTVRVGKFHPDGSSEDLLRLPPEPGNRLNPADRKRVIEWADGQFAFNEWPIRILANGVETYLPDFGVIASSPTLFKARDDSLWAATDVGLFRFRHNQPPRRFTVADHFPDGWVRTMFEDDAGSLWLGTDRKGLARLTPKSCAVLSRANGLVDDDAWNVQEGPGKLVFVGTSRGLTVYDGASLKTLFQSRPRFEIRSSITQDGTAYVVDRDHLYRLGEQEPIIEESVSRNGWPGWPGGVRQDQSARLWYHSTSGLYYKTNSLWVNLLHPFTNETIRFTSVFQTKDRSYWFGTIDHGVIHTSDLVKFARYSKDDGLAHNFARAVLEDEDGTVWFATRGGLTRYRQGRFSSATDNHGLPDREVQNIVDDLMGWLWINCNVGVYRTARSQIEEFFQGKRKTVDCLLYGTADGMLSPQCNEAAGPNSCRTSDGLLWFPTVRGVAVFDPKRLKSVENAPRVLIQRFTSGESILYDSASPKGSGASAGSKHALQLYVPPAHAHKLRIEFTAPEYISPGRIAFWHRLKPLEKEWKPNGNYRLVEYTYLKPGSYQFEVKARGGRGLSSESPAVLSFQIGRRFYQIPFFAVACFALLFVLAHIFYKRQLLTVLRIETLEKQALLEQERVRIAQDMHDDLGGSLMRVKLLSELATEDACAELKPILHDIQSTIRDTAQKVDEIVWAVNPKNDTLNSFIDYASHFSQEFLNGTNVRLRLHETTDLPSLPLGAETRHNLFMILKEALSNVLKHSGATEVTVRFSVEAGVLSLCIADNGKSFDPARLCTVECSGLANMKARAAELGGAFEITIESGTKVTTRIPLNNECN